MLSDSAQPRPPHRLLSSVSILFWVCLLVWSVSVAGLALLPGWQEQQYLRQQLQRQELQLQALEAEIRHLRLLQNTLEQDPEFSRQVASTTLNQSDQNRVEIKLPAELIANPLEHRRAEASPVPVNTHSNPIDPWMTLFAQSNPRWWWAAAIGFLLVFSLLHEGVWTGSARGVLRHFVTRAWGRYLRADIPPGADKAD